MSWYLVVRRSATLVALAAQLGVPAIAGAQPAPAAPAPPPPPAVPPAIVDVSSQFPPGPYSALSTAVGDPASVALGTEGGVVAWSHDGGVQVSSADVLIYRKMDPVTLRGQDSAGYGALGGSDEDPRYSKTAKPWAKPHQSPFEWSHIRDMHRPLSSSTNRRGPPLPDDSANTPREPTDRSIYTFMDMLEAGLPSGQWHVWMTVYDPITVVTSVSLPPGDGPMGIAAQHGIYLSDQSRGAWTKAVGAPGIMPQMKDEVGVSVGVDPRNRLHILAGTDRGLMRSTDGGATFLPHPDRAVEGAWITKILWDPSNPALVFLVTPEQIFLSQDGGQKFEPSFAADGEITDLALNADAAIVATSEGLYLAYADRMGRALQGTPLVGAAAWTGGSVIAASADALFLVQPDGTTVRLRTTNSKDPFLKVAGGGGLIWVISKDNVYRLGAPRPRRRGRPVKLLLSASELADAVFAHQGFGLPKHTRFYRTWWTKLIPEIEVHAIGVLEGADLVERDGTFPIGDRFNVAESHDRFEWSVYASWELSHFFGHAHNPRLIIESNLRAKQQELVDKIHRAYRETADAAAQLATIPEDDEAAVLQQFRFEELVSYLEFMSGKPLVDRTQHPEFRP